MIEFRPVDPDLTAEDLGRVHLIGVGGVGMSGLARLLLTRGIPTSGSELHEWPTLAALAGLGGTIFRQHTESNLDGVDTVVFSSAIPQDHVELVTARRRGLRVLHRSEALAVAMNGRRTVAIAGTHGKTTTTSMTVTVLTSAGLDPSYVIGGEIGGGTGNRAETGAGGQTDVGSGAAASNARHGAGEYFVAEADESDRSFLLYQPYVGVLTNVEADHLNTYGDLEGLHRGFFDFTRQIRPDGFLVACADDAGSRSIADRAAKAGTTVYTYGEAPDADLRLSKLDTDVTGVRYHASLGDTELGGFSLPVPGRHMALNSAAALLTALKLGVPASSARQALDAFPGVRRRFELQGVVNGVRVYDEYAYHPTSITLALRTLREVAGAGRLIAVFQPYRMYRTRDLHAELADAIGTADVAVVLEVFGPGEERRPGEGGASLVEAVPLPRDRKVFVPEWADVPAEVAARARPGDVVVTMGAPPISLLGRELLAALSTSAGRPRS